MPFAAMDPSRSGKVPRPSFWDEDEDIPRTSMSGPRMAVEFANAWAGEGWRIASDVVTGPYHAAKRILQGSPRTLSSDEPDYAVERDALIAGPGALVGGSVPRLAAGNAAKAELGVMGGRGGRVTPEDVTRWMDEAGVPVKRVSTHGEGTTYVQFEPPGNPVRPGDSAPTVRIPGDEGGHVGRRPTTNEVGNRFDTGHGTDAGDGRRIKDKRVLQNVSGEPYADPVALEAALKWRTSSAPPGESWLVSPDQAPRVPVARGQQKAPAPETPWAPDPNQLTLLAGNGRSAGIARAAEGSGAYRHTRNLSPKELEEMRALVKAHPEQADVIRASYGMEEAEIGPRISVTIDKQSQPQRMAPATLPETVPVREEPWRAVGPKARALDDEMLGEARHMIENGASVSSIAEELGVHHSTLSMRLKQGYTKRSAEESFRLRPNTSPLNDDGIRQLILTMKRSGETDRAIAEHIQQTVFRGEKKITERMVGGQIHRMRTRQELEAAGLPIPAELRAENDWQAEVYREDAGRFSRPISPPRADETAETRWLASEVGRAADAIDEDFSPKRSDRVEPMRFSGDSLPGPTRDDGGIERLVGNREEDLRTTARIGAMVDYTPGQRESVNVDDQRPTFGTRVREFFAAFGDDGNYDQGSPWRGLHEMRAQ